MLRQVQVSLLLLLFCTACAVRPADSVKEEHARIEAGLTRIARADYQPEVLIYVPAGSRLLRNPDHERFPPRTRPLLESGTLLEIWIWHGPEKSLASFNGFDFDYDLSNPRDRVELFARAYGG